jgi:Asp-tRNA(Asn)/Glu-tRNA(Gln) amidotransferase A subunit family amidase
VLQATESLRRIEERDGPIRAFVEVLAKAPDLDETTTATALHGVGVAVKDLYRVDGMATRAGSTLPPELFDGAQSDIVTRIEAAGGIVVGKTALDEFAYSEPPPTRNPLDLSRTPGGSSGGSAAAVAAGMCDLAIGSQSLQSTIVPAAYCGIVGCKPSYGRWPFDGVPLSPSFDTVGFLASSVADLDRALAATADSWSPPDDPRLTRIGIPTAWGRSAHREGWERFGGHVRRLRDRAAIELVRCDVPWNDDPVGWASAVGDLVNGEFARVQRDWFAAHPDRYRPRTAAAIERGQSVTDERLAECRTMQAAASAALHAQMDELDLDCYACPSVGGVAPVGYEITGDSWMTCFWSLAGLPCVSVPTTDEDEAMPRGIQLVGRHGQDERLVACALEVEALVSDD